MIRIVNKCRPEWQELLKKQGFTFHTNSDGTEYWKEDAYYQLTSQEQCHLFHTIRDLHQICLNVIPKIVDADSNWMSKMNIPDKMQKLIRTSWVNDRHRYVYGRFDLLSDDHGIAKLLEYNADTPTSLLEAGRIQKLWAHENHHVQFNTVESNIVSRWKLLYDFDRYIRDTTVYFSSIKDHPEDEATTRYMMSLAEEAGLSCKFIFLEDIIFDEVHDCFMDTADIPITTLWKLYPWEWMMDDEFFVHIDKLTIIEPAWKLLLSNKAILPILYHYNRDNLHILPATFTAKEMVEHEHITDYVEKPLLGREGANITIKEECSNKDYVSIDGGYTEDGYIYQKLCKAESFDEKYIVIGGWVIGDEPAGISIREDFTRVTTNISQFAPHAIH